MKVFFFFISFLFCSCVFTQVIPVHRVTDWSNPGSNASFSSFGIVNFEDYAPDTTGTTDCSPLLSQLLQDYQSPIKIIFPAGRFLFSTHISLRDSIILEGKTDETGENASTILLGEKENHGIIIAGNKIDLGISITHSLHIGQNKIAKINNWNANVGDVIRFIPTDEANLITSSWAQKTTGQIFEIVAITADSIVLNKPIRRDYDVNFPVGLYLQKPTQQVHIVCLNVEKLDASVNQTNNIHFQTARHCSVRGVNSLKTNYGHVVAFESSNITVENSFFYDSFGFGGGGKGYGVVLLNATGDSYIHANIFKKLRHSMLLQAGANGNVFAYNYSYDVYWEEVSLPADAAGDMCLHGNYPYMNLFEGNVAQNLVIDASHGINGKHNTFFRNRAENYGLLMVNNPASDEQNFIGNQFPNMDNFKGLYIIFGFSPFEFGNFVKGTIRPTGTTESSLLSMFNYNFSNFYTHIGQIPAITMTNASASFFNEAQYRYLQKTKKAICEMIDYSSEVGIDEVVKEEIELFPNPASLNVQIKTNILSEIYKIEIIDLNGKTRAIYHQNFESIHLPVLADGMYIMQIFAKQTVSSHKIIIKN